MPGWGIFADLLPPELVASRQLRKLQKRLLAGLIAVLVLCACGYAYAIVQHSSAANSLKKTQATSAAISAEQVRYADVTRIRSANSVIQAQIATAMAGDVDFAKFLASIRAALPATMSIASETVTLNPLGSPKGNSASASLSGADQLGTVTIAGSGQTLADLPVFVKNLQTVTGVVDIIPGSNALSGQGTSTAFTVTFGVTSAVLSHRFDGKAAK
jgi:hypothetical protein